MGIVVLLYCLEDYEKKSHAQYRCTHNRPNSTVLCLLELCGVLLFVEKFFSPTLVEAVEVYFWICCC